MKTLKILVTFVLLLFVVKSWRLLQFPETANSERLLTSSEERREKIQNYVDGELDELQNKGDIKKESSGTKTTDKDEEKNDNLEDQSVDDIKHKGSVEIQDVVQEDGNELKTNSIGTSQGESGVK